MFAIVYLKVMFTNKYIICFLMSQLNMETFLVSIEIKWRDCHSNDAFIDL